MAAIVMLPTCIDNQVSPRFTRSKRYTSRKGMMAILPLGCLLQIAHTLRKVSSEPRSAKPGDKPGDRRDVPHSPNPHLFLSSPPPTKQPRHPHPKSPLFCFLTPTN